MKQNIHHFMVETMAEECNFLVRKGISYPAMWWCGRKWPQRQWHYYEVWLYWSRYDLVGGSILLWEVCFEVSYVLKLHSV